MAGATLSLLGRARVAAATVAHLKPVQIVDRVRRKVVPARRPRLAGIAVFREGGRPSPPARSIDGGFDGRSFRFINLRHAFEGSDRWRALGAPSLWAYHLHYFDWVHGLDDRTALQMMLDWVDAVEPSLGPGWDPYPISLRTREWCEWLASRWGSLPEDDRHTLVTSLAEQAQVLRQRVENHLQGNHLLENAISLCWLGLRVEGPGMAGALGDGIALLEREVASQVLSDGVHEERSPSYQARICEALLRLAEVGKALGGEAGARVERCAGEAGRRRVGALSRLTHSDGEVALLNDSGIGWAATARQLAARFDLPDAGAPDGFWALESAGFAGVDRQGFSLVVDGGPIGPDHQPGHGHADTLTFELSVGGRRLITDTGVFTYEPGDQRLADRGTAAHNTVQLDDRDQCELWSAFRCGRRPKVGPIEVRRTDGGGVVIRGEYRAPLGALGWYGHSRRFEVAQGHVLIRDDVRAPGDHRATLRLHLAPEVGARLASGDSRAVELADDRRVVARVRGEAPWRLNRTPYHPDFNIEHERWCLEAVASFRESLSTEWSIEILESPVP